MQEIIFAITEDLVEGGYCASTLGHGIHTQAETLEELGINVREAVACHFGDEKTSPQVIRL